MSIRILRLHSNAIIPSYATPGAAGMDLHAVLDAPLTLEKGARALVPTGLAIALPADHEAQVRPRSGLAWKHGITCLNSPGTIDEDYRGEIKVLLINHGQEPHTIASGDRIAQLVIARVAKTAFVEVSDASQLSTTARGAGGFGSTGR